MFNGGNVAAPLDKLLLVSHCYTKGKVLWEIIIYRETVGAVSPVAAALDACNVATMEPPAPATKAAILSGRVITPAGSGGM